MPRSDKHVVKKDARPLTGITIQTPGGPHRIPDYARCYCTTRHTPKYMHTLPYELPDGKIMYFCPTTHHSVTLLVNEWRKYGEKPPNYVNFTQPVRRMAKLVMLIDQYGIPAERYVRLWAIKKLEQEVGDDL